MFKGRWSTIKWHSVGERLKDYMDMHGIIQADAAKHVFGDESQQPLVSRTRSGFRKMRNIAEAEKWLEFLNSQTPKAKLTLEWLLCKDTIATGRVDSEATPAPFRRSKSARGGEK